MDRAFLIVFYFSAVAGTNLTPTVGTIDFSSMGILLRRTAAAIGFTTGTTAKAASAFTTVATLRLGAAHFGGHLVSSYFFSVASM